jgi:hypothetical protein
MILELTNIKYFKIDNEKKGLYFPKGVDDEYLEEYLRNEIKNVYHTFDGSGDYNDTQLFFKHTDCITIRFMYHRNIAIVYCGQIQRNGEKPTNIQMHRLEDWTGGLSEFLKNKALELMNTNKRRKK